MSKLVLEGTLAEFAEAVRVGRGYDFIANNYYMMSKEELKTIALECFYQLSRVQEKEMLEELTEREGVEVLEA